MVPYAKLRGKIASEGYNWTDLAEKIGVSPPTIQNRLHGKYPFTTIEIEKICKVLKIKKSERNTYFFGQNVYK